MSERSPREAELIAAVAVLGAEYDRWAELPTEEPPTAALERTAEAFIDVAAAGDVPAACRDLVANAADFAHLWREYANGAYDPRTGMPDRCVWRALEAVRKAAAGAVSFVPRRPEPVAVLLKQGVPHRQIALYIYGHDGKGPFVGPNGQPLVELIEREGEKPGSVIPADWVHPSETAKVASFRRESLTKLTAAVGDRRTAKPDAGGIAGMLRDGAYVGQILTAVPGSTHAEIQRVAAELGLAATAAPNLAAGDPKDRLDLPAVRPAYAPAAPDADPAAEAAAPGEDVEADDIETWVGLYATTGDDAKTIAKRIATEGGPKVHPNKVRAILEQMA